MPSQSNFSLSRWFGLCQLRNSIREKSDHVGGGGDINEENPISYSIECFACTQVGVPVFQSTSCTQNWNRAFLLARAMALAIDPLFFYALSIGRGGSPCLYMDGGLAAIVTVLRTCVDAVHLFYLWLQFKLAYVSRESLVVGCGKLVWDARAIVSHYVRSRKGFWFDAFGKLVVMLCRET